jgi:hypothetical protein
MRLDCYATSARPPRLAPARADRPWMDAFPARHAYRCLPLSIANTYGWELLAPADLTIDWNGGPDAADIQFACADDAFSLDGFVMSNFTHGIVTFHTGYLFRTEPGWNLLATGPMNRPKDGISPLSGVVETDWLPYPFTMNWQLTRPGAVRFEKDEPYCLVVPVPAGALGEVQPHLHRVESNPELAAQYAAWRTKRSEFMAAFRAGDPATLRQAWQKYYFKGELPDSDQLAAGHVQKLRLAEPVDLRDSEGGSPSAVPFDPAVYYVDMAHPLDAPHAAGAASAAPAEAATERREP